MAGDPRALLQQADSKLASAGKGFSFFGNSKEDKYQDAADTYVQAANAFRMQKQSREAGKAFEKAAEVQRSKLNEPGDAANTLTEAFKAYKQDSPEDAIRCIDFSINEYCKTGNFRRAAQHKASAAELLEMQVGDTKKALEYYETAAEWYNNDNAPALANKYLLKVADMAALEGDYYKAIEKFEAVAEQSINNNLTRYSVKSYYLKSGICHMATKDLVATQRALQKYGELDNSFPPTREFQLLSDLLSAIEAGEQEKFADCLYNFDKVQRLEKWHTEILLRVKNQIEEQGDDFS